MNYNPPAFVIWILTIIISWENALVNLRTDYSSQKMQKAKQQCWVGLFSGVWFPSHIITSNHMFKANHYLLMDETLGTFSWSQTPSDSSFSRISQANKVMFSFLYRQIAFTTLGVATLGFDPPIILGLIEPVSWNLESMEVERCLPVDWADTRNVLWCANAFGQQTVTYFPGEHGGVFLFVFDNWVYHWWGGYFWLWASDYTGLYGASFKKSAMIPASLTFLPWSRTPSCLSSQLLG